MARIRKGDKVKVISGKDRGRTGTVVKVLKQTNRVIVEGINVVKKHEKPQGQDKPGGIIDKEAPIHISNVMVLDPKDNKPSRLGTKVNKDGSKVRYAKRTNNELKN